MEKLLEPRFVPAWAVVLGGIATAFAFPLQPDPHSSPFSVWPLCFVGPAPFLARLWTARSYRQAAFAALLFALPWFLIAGVWVFRVFDAAGWVLIWLPVGWVVIFGLAAHATRTAGFAPGWCWPLLWVAVEFIRAEWTPLRLDWFSKDLDPLNFTWFGLGHPRLHVCWASQTADLFGGYFLSVLPFLASLLVARIMLVPVRSWRTSPARMGIVLPVLAFALAELGYTIYHLPNVIRSFNDGPTVLAGVVQSERSSLPVLLDLTRDVLAARPRTTLIVWPEESFTGRPADRDLLQALADAEGVTLAVGVEEMQPDGSHRNAVWWLSPNGKPGVYYKRQRVPFVERHAAGGELPVFQVQVDRGEVRAAVLICYDMDFAWNARDAVKAGAELLVMPTLDDVSWGGSQHSQHALLPRLRAIETRRSVVQAATSGVSQIIDPLGGVVAEIPFRMNPRPDRPAQYLEGFTVGAAPANAAISPYCAGGWLAGPVVATVGMLLTAFSLLRRSRLTTRPSLVA